MKHILCALLGISLLASAVQNSRAVDAVWNYAVEASATVQSSPAQITLSWPQDSSATPISYTVYRKAPGATSWGNALATLPGSQLSYADSSVSAGTTYEYQIVKNGGTYNGYGYVQAAVNAPLVENRGKVILVVDNTYASQLAGELSRLQQELTGDGWTVLRHDVSRTATVAGVKNLIKADYNADPQNVKSVFLFGHVPVPQSGQFNPDGHPDHVGAWSSDSFYGVMNDGGFTDSSVNFAQTVNTDPADAARLSNFPGDGKYDPVQIAGNVDLQVGRVDLANMPGQVVWGGPATFKSELELLRQYLNKDHNYRMKTMTARRRAVVGDYFGSRGGEGFAASGYRNGAAFFGANNVDSVNVMYNDQQGTWVPYLQQNDYLFAYGCGAGSYTSIGGLGNAANYNGTTTPEIVNSDIRAVFVNFFGSWLGDFDHSDNIMRAVLATPTYGLACAWSGRPHWFMHPMALGETIGYTAKLTQNNNGLYQNQVNSAAHDVHIALMGDPTLRLHQMAPPTALNGTPSGSSVNLTWTGSADAGLGYYVYRANNAAGPYTRVSTLINSTSYIDSTAPAGTNYYMVRAIKLEVGGGGSYTNASQGAFWPASGSFVSTGGTTTGGGTTTTNPPSTGTTNSGGTTTTTTNSTTTGSTTNTNSTGTTNTGSTTGTTSFANTAVWVEDALPTGATGLSTGGDAWSWVAANPAPYSGSFSHQSANSAGLHEHYFNYANSTLAVNTGDTLFAYVYLDPANPPTEIMLAWNDSNGSWEHRAYWGANNIGYGTDGTAGRYHVGNLPATGQWVQLAVPAKAVGLEGKSLQGMDYAAYSGKVTWDYAGSATVQSSTTTANPGTTNTTTGQTVSVTAYQPYAVINSTNNATLTFARAGSTSAALTVNFVLGGNAVKWTDYRRVEGDMPVSVTIPAGAASATMNIRGIANTMNANPETATFTLSSDPSYTVGSPNISTVTILPTGSTQPAATNGGGIGTTTNITGTVTNTVGSGTNAVTSTNTVSNTNNLGYNTNTVGTVNTGGTNSSSTNNAGATTNSGPVLGLVTNTIPGSGPADYLTLHLPKIGDTTLHVLNPTLLELHLINTKPQNGSPTNWNFVDGSFNFSAPALNNFTVTVNGQNVSVSGVGFKRRALAAPLASYDMRLDSVLYLQLSTPVADNATVQVTNPNGSLWGPSTQFVTTADPLRYSPAIHVNQEGYVPSFPKKAMVGYYLGNLGEMPVTATTFKIVDAATGNQVFSGSLTLRKDIGYTYSPSPYQNVWEADFSSLTTPGQYRLVVPGLGASLPFVIQDGIAMDFARTYALGLFEQRSGFNVAMPYTRFTHAADHTAPAAVPTSASAYAFTWNCIAGYAKQPNSDNPTQTAPILTDPTKQLFPFVNTSPVDVSGGHFDAGDYSKYTWDIAQLVHFLMFSADSLPGVGQMDNLGIAESGDGIGDVIQEAKWEADCLAKLQDTDGGFYYVVYPQNSEYESGSLPENGSAQVVWPKQTACTAAAVAALAETASSPAFKAAYPQAAANYMAKAKLGWQFLTNAIAKYGKTGAYQKMMHFGDDFTDQDDLAWAACEMYLATGDQSYHTTLKQWFPDPTSSSTFRWGWWKMYGSWGNAVRDYAFAAKSGRLQASQLDSAYLAKCVSTITSCADDTVKWSQDNAYGSSFPDQTKAVRGAGWYYSPEQAFDITVGYQFNQDPKYLDAIVRNLNYEGGCNPVNVTYITGLGTKRHRDVVDQYAANDRRLMPKDGVPIGNIEGGFVWTGTYGSSLEAMDFPSDDASSAPYPYYDRWGDSWNVTTEASTDDTVRCFATAAALAGLTSTKSQAWTYANGSILTSGAPSQGQPMTVSLSVPGMDLNGARIVWEAQGAEPSYGSTFTFTPTNYGSAWIEAEAQWPDGRRVFAVTNFFAGNSLPTVTVAASNPNAQIGTTNYGVFTFNRTGSTSAALTVNFELAGSAVKWDDYRRPEGDMPQTVTIPAGAASASINIKGIGNETGASPETILLTLSANQAYNLGSPYFTTMNVTTAYIPVTNSTSGGTTTTNTSGGGTVTNTNTTGTVTNTVPGGGTTTTNGTSGGTTTTNSGGGTVTLPVISVTATTTNASRVGPTNGVFTFNRSGNTSSAVTVNFNLSGTATNGTDYTASSTAVTIPAGATSATWTVTPKSSTTLAQAQSVVLTIASGSGYTTGANSATLNLAGNSVPSNLKVIGGMFQVKWASITGKTYHVAYKTSLTATTWTDISSDVTATGSQTTWTDHGATLFGQRYYIVYVTN